MRAAEADAELDEWGVMCPGLLPVESHAQPVHDGLSADGRDPAVVGVVSFMLTPTEADMKGPLAPADRTVLGDRE